MDSPAHWLYLAMPATAPPAARFGIVFQGRWAANVPLTAGGATIVILPSLLIYILFQRQFIRGVTAGSLSGQ
ncbi:MAG: hypothetical protein ABI904_22520 [Chloroflexota bacterium]